VALLTGAPRAPAAGPRLRARCAALAALGSCVLAPAPAAADRPGEYEVKAAFLLNFARLVEWPPEAFGDPRAPLGVAALAPEAVYEDLRRLLHGKTVAGRSVQVRRVAGPGELAGDHVVFLGAGSRASLSEVLEATRRLPALVVSEQDGHARLGAAINFFLESRKVRFEINPGAAQRAGLKLSARLLQVAVIVEGGSS
jgi:hypothetical protein